MLTEYCVSLVDQHSQIRIPYHGSTLLLVDRAVGDSLLGRGTALDGHFAGLPWSLLHPALAALRRQSTPSARPPLFYGMGPGSAGVALAPSLVCAAHQPVSDVIYWSQLLLHLPVSYTHLTLPTIYSV